MFLLSKIKQIFKKPGTAWLFSSGFIAFILLSCLIPLLWNSFATDDAWAHLATYLLPTYIANTLLLVLGVGLSTLFLGVSMAYLTTRYQFVGRKWISNALVLPLAVPSYLLAYALSGFFDYTGPFKQAMAFALPASLANHAYMDLQHLPGLILVISIALYPYVYLAAKTSFSQLSKQYVPVGLSLQLSENKTWRTLILPMASPAILGSLLLVIMECLNDYGASKYFGINTLTTGVFRAWFSMNSLASASKLAAMLLGFILLLIWLKNILHARKKYFTQGQQKPLKRTEVAKPIQLCIALFCLLPVIIGVLIPLIFMAYAWIQAHVDLSFIPYASLIKNSFLLAISVAGITTIVSFLWQFSAHYFKSKGLLTLVRAASIGYTIPGAVIGIGVIGLAAYVNQISHWYISGTLLVLLFGLVFRLIAVSYQNVQAGFTQLPKSTVDLGRSLGIPGRTMFRRIYLPLNKSYLAIGFLLVFIDVLKELPLTLILRPFNFDTLATKTYEYANDELLFSAFHVAPLILLISLLPIWLLQKMNRYE